jgi:single-strand DNA-binding protein
MLNKVALIGRVGKDPVVKHFENGGKIAEFTLATDDSYKDKQGNKVEQTDWHNIKIAFPKLAEVAEKWVKKGSLLYVEGKIKTRSYDDKDGNKRYVTEVVCESFKMLGDKKDKTQEDRPERNQENPTYGTTTTTRNGIETEDDSELPF